MNRMSWAREMLMLQQAERRAVGAARDARANMRYSPGSATPAQVAVLEAAARAAQDAVTAHFNVKTG